MKSKDVILGPKADTLEKHVGKTRRHATIGQEIRRMVCQQEMQYAKNEIACFKKNHFTIAKQVQGRVWGGGVKSGFATILHLL